MILVNTDFIPGKEFEVLSIVKGSTIQTRHVGKDIMSGLKNIVGGELKAYVEMVNHARALATKRMVEEAEQLGADAVINIMYSTRSILQGAAEILAYRTAVQFT